MCNCWTCNLKFIYLFRTWNANICEVLLIKFVLRYFKTWNLKYLQHLPLLAVNIHQITFSNILYIEERKQNWILWDTNYFHTVSVVTRFHHAKGPYHFFNRIFHWIGPPGWFSLRVEMFVCLSAPLDAVFFKASWKSSWSLLHSLFYNWKSYR